MKWKQMRISLKKQRLKSFRVWIWSYSLWLSDKDQCGYNLYCSVSSLTNTVRGEERRESFRFSSTNFFVVIVLGAVSIDSLTDISDGIVNLIRKSHYLTCVYPFHSMHSLRFLVHKHSSNDLLFSVTGKRN